VITNPGRCADQPGELGRAVWRSRHAERPSSELLGRAARMAAALGGSPGERAKLVRELVEKIIVDEKTIIIKLRRGLLLARMSRHPHSEAASDSAVELTATAAFTRRGAEPNWFCPD